MWNCTKCAAEVEENLFACWQCDAPKPGIDDRVEWFESGDSSLMVIPETLLHEWNGSDPSAPSEPSQDLERAFAIEGWIGTIPVGTDQALVLNDIPTNAAFFQRNGKLCILRWLCADNANDLVKLAESTVTPSETSPPVSFLHPGGNLCLIGVGDIGADLGYQPSVVNLAAGSYSVATCIIQETRTEVLIHQFDPTK
jgi:hypothetical protein